MIFDIFKCSNLLSLVCLDHFPHIHGRETTTKLFKIYLLNFVNLLVNTQDAIQAIINNDKISDIFKKHYRNTK